MSIQHLIKSGGNELLDKVMKKSLVPTDIWKDDSGWTKDKGAVVSGNKFNIIPTDTALLSENTTGTSNRPIGNGYIYAQTFTTPSTNYFLKDATIKVSIASGHNPPNDLFVKVTTLDANGNPDLTNVISEAVLPRNNVPVDGTGRNYTISFLKTVKLTGGTKYAFYFYTDNPDTSTNYYTVYYDNTTTDTYVGGGEILSSDGGATWTATSTRDYVFTLNGGNTIPSSVSAYADFDQTKGVTALDKFNFTTETDGTNSVKVDLTDTSGNIIKENVTSTTDLSEYLDYDKVRLKVTLALNGSTNIPRITSYEVKRFKDHSFFTNNVSKAVSFSTKQTTFQTIVDVSGRGAIRKILAWSNYQSSTEYATLVIEVDGKVWFNSRATSSGTVGICHHNDIWNESNLSHNFVEQPYIKDEWNVFGTILVYDGIEFEKSLVVKIKHSTGTYSADAKAVWELL